MPSLMKFIGEMGLNISPFQAGMKKAEQAANAGMASIGNQIKGLVGGYFGFKALEAAVINVARRAGQIKDMAEQFSISTDEVQKLGAAAESTGLEFEAMGSALLKVSDARRRAIGGDEGAIAAFNLLGVGARAGGDETDLEILKAIGEALKKMDSSKETIGAVKELTGKSGPRLMEALRELGVDRGPLISKESLQSIEDAEEALKRLRREWDAFVAPGIAKGANALGDVVEGGPRQFLRDYADQITSLGLVNFKWFRELTGQDDPSRGEASTEPGALPRSAKQKAQDLLNKAAHLKAHPEDASIIDAIFGTDAELGKKADQVEQMINPKRLLALGKLRADVEAKQSAMAFGKLSSEGKLASLLKDKQDAEDQIAFQNKQQVDALYTKEVKEENILNLTKQKLDAEEKILALQKQGGGSDVNLRLIREGRLTPASFGAPSAPPTYNLTPLGVQIVKEVQAMQASLKAFGERKIFLGN